MNLKIDELKLILKWFDIAEESLEDIDLKLYDKIKDCLEDQGIDLTETEEDEEDELTFFTGKEDGEDEDSDYDRFDDDEEEDD